MPLPCEETSRLLSLVLLAAAGWACPRRRAVVLPSLAGEGGRASLVVLLRWRCCASVVSRVSRGATLCSRFCPRREEKQGDKCQSMCVAQAVLGRGFASGDMYE